MSIVSFPYDEPLPVKIVCALCRREIRIEYATIGPINARGVVSLLCNGHLWEDRKFVDELADYTASERQKLSDLNGHNLTRYEAEHVRTLY
jgi:hypothetical protein